jgi:hypothetical protein
MSNIRNEVYNQWVDGNYGRPILLSAVSLATAQLLHTAVNDPDYFDEIWIWGNGLDSALTLVAIGFGGLAVGDLQYANIPAQGSGAWCIIPAWRLAGGLPVYGFGNRSASCNLKLQVNRTRKVTTA